MQAVFFSILFYLLPLCVQIMYTKVFLDMFCTNLIPILTTLYSYNPEKIISDLPIHGLEQSDYQRTKKAVVIPVMPMKQSNIPIR